MLTYGTLQSIKYPTGGKTIFTYEPHEYDNAFHVDTEIEQTSKLSLMTYICIALQVSIHKITL